MHTATPSSLPNSVVISKFFSSGWQYSHPYGVSFDPSRQRVYVSNQNGDDVIFFSLSDPSTISSFAYVPNPRGVAVDPITGNVFVASVGWNSVMVYSPNGTEIQSIDVKHPISLHINTNTLFISSFRKPPASYAKLYSFTISHGIPYKHSLYNFSDPHPTGMVLVDDKLYVLGQNTSSLYSLSLQKGSTEEHLASFDDYPEHLILSDCWFHGVITYFCYHRGYGPGCQLPLWILRMERTTTRLIILSVS